MELLANLSTKALKGIGIVLTLAGSAIGIVAGCVSDQRQKNEMREAVKEEVDNRLREREHPED